MDYRFIQRTVTEAEPDGVVTIVMNRPDVLNSCNREMVAELTDAFEGAGRDAAVRCVILTGAGRAFCAGQDLAEAVPAEGEIPDIGGIVEGYNRLIRAIRALEKPVVAAVNGVAAGAGANIALACDFVVAADNASFIQAFAKIGLVPDNGGTFFLPRLVGMARATQLAMLAEKVPAQQALEWGMIYKVVPAAELGPTATAFARMLAQQPTRGLGLIKRALDAAWENTLDEQLALEARLQGEAGRTHDYLEGVRAFQAKRAPKFEGR
jgi:2-(1,2-epoxy-1,2-dihydrophenyl)acetyl-CoA isomerase